MDEWERYSRIFNLDKTEDVISQQHFLCHLTHGGGGGETSVTFGHGQDG